jgi:transposase
MPYKSYSRGQDWLLPPSLGELIPADHAVRFVAEFVDNLDWAAVGIKVIPESTGAPAYAPQMLLAAWLYGFMTRTRSSRRIERACAEGIPMMWLTGLQRPDHTTLARFYQQNRQAMRPLFKATVRLAIEVDLVDFALQAVDGTRMGAAARGSLHSREEIAKLLIAVEAELTAMDAAQASETDDTPAPPSGPRAPLGREQVREHLLAAQAEFARREALPGGRNDADAVSASDPDAALIKAPAGYVVGYNAQAVVDSKAQIVVAADVTNCSSDGEQLLPMLAEVQAMTGRLPQAAAGDSGYFDIGAIVEATGLGLEVFVPQPRRKPKSADAPATKYTKANFAYDPATDTYACPEGQTLTFQYREPTHHGKPNETRTYQCHACAGCAAAASGACTTNARGRIVKRYEHDGDLPAHLDKMQSAAGKAVTRQRSGVVEPLFASTKERLGMLRFLLAGLLNAKAEWRLTCAAHNLLKLWRLWWRPRQLAGAAAN